MRTLNLASLSSSAEVTRRAGQGKVLYFQPSIITTTRDLPSDIQCGALGKTNNLADYIVYVLGTSSYGALYREFVGQQD